MARTITDAVGTAAAAEHVRVFALAEFDFASGFVRFTSAPHKVVFNGNTYTGAGDFGKISPVEEGVEQKAYQLVFRLSGIPAAMISTALSEDYQGRACNLWFALLDVNYAIITDPVLIFAGIMDTMNISAGKEAEISIVVNSRLARWEQAVNHRWNNAAQQAVFPADKGLEFVEQVAEKELSWPAR